MIAVVVGAIGFLIPGIFLMILFIYNGLGILIDGKSIFASFAYSAKLVWGNWWRTLIVFLISFIFMIRARCLIVQSA